MLGPDARRMSSEALLLCECVVAAAQRSACWERAAACVVLEVLLMLPHRHLHLPLLLHFWHCCCKPDASDHEAGG